MYDFSVIKLGIFGSNVLAIASVVLFLIYVRPEMKKDGLRTTWLGVFCPPLIFIDLAREGVVRKRNGRKTPKFVGIVAYLMLSSLVLLTISVVLFMTPPQTTESREIVIEKLRGK